MTFKQASVTIRRQHLSQELKEMLPKGVLSIAIRADFWQPQENERKGELIKY